MAQVSGAYIHVKETDGTIKDVYLYSSTSDFDGAASDIGRYTVKYNGTDAYIAYTNSQSTDSYKAYGTGMRLNINGTVCYVLTQIYNPSGGGDTHTYTYRSYDTFVRIASDYSIAAPKSDIYYNDSSYDPWNSIPGSNSYMTIYKVTRDDGEVRYCYTQDWFNPIDNGCWYCYPPVAMGRYGEGQQSSYIYWEQAYAYSIVDGYMTEYAGGYNILAEPSQWDWDHQDDTYPSQSRQPDSAK